MTIAIDRILAQQIVDTVHDVCGKNINFIDSSGRILASTDETRIGTYHEIGYQIGKSGEMREIEQGHQFPGTQEGINLPIYHNRRVIAVIGITGKPEEVRKYAYLAERITQLFIREKELESSMRSMEEKRHYVIQSLISGEEQVNRAYLDDCIRSFGIREDTEKRILLIQMLSRADASKSRQMEQSIRQIFLRLSVPIDTFEYPGTYIALLEEESFQNSASSLEHFAKQQRDVLRVGVGKSCGLHSLKESYQTGCIALKNGRESGKEYVVFDELALEIILDSVKPQNKEEFRDRILHGLDREDLKILKAYFETGMSLKDTCEKLYLHKNTLQYKLNRIGQACGYNPRKFQDAVLLYLAVRITEQQEQTAGSS